MIYSAITSSFYTPKLKLSKFHKTLENKKFQSMKLKMQWRNKKNENVEQLYGFISERTKQLKETTKKLAKT